MAKVVFCQRVFYSYFGFMTISALLKKHGHKIELVMESDAQKVTREVLEINPQMVMFSTLTATGDFEWALDIANRIKKQNKNILTVFGSTHPTLFPEETIRYEAVDIICRGEGEFPILELCNRFDSGQDFLWIPNLWVKAKGVVTRNPIGEIVEDLDSFPFPDRALYQKYGYFDHLDSVDVMAGRGCLFNCSYCMNTTTKEMMRGKGKFVRKHSVAYMIAQLEDVIEKYNPKSFTFVDELFTVNKKWIREFFNQYRQRIKLPFVCSITADTIDDESARLLAEAGVSRICMGLETGNEKLRHEVLNKNITNEEFIRAAHVLHKYKIKFLTSNIIGLPGETVDNAFETIEFNQHLKTDFLYFSVFQPYPGLPITKEMQERGDLPKYKPSEYHSTFFKDSMLKQKNIHELVNLHKFFLIAVKCPWLKPLIRQLIKWPPNKIFEWVFIASYGWMQLVCFRRNSFQLLAMGIGNMKIFNASKKNLNASPGSVAMPINKDHGLLASSKAG